MKISNEIKDLIGKLLVILSLPFLPILLLIVWIKDKIYGTSEEVHAGCSGADI
jgi:hypothetical protein